MAIANREQLIDEIIDRISSGEPLRQICRDEHMPAWRTVYDWLEQDKGFSARFARARELGFDAIAQGLLEIADSETDHRDDVQHRKLRIWTRLQLLAKWDPKRYGDKQRLEHAGDPDSPVVTEIRIVGIDGRADG